MSEPTEQELREIAADLLAQGMDPNEDTGSPKFTEENYPDWNSNDRTTRVISGPLGDKAKFSGTRYTNWRTAQKEVNNRFRVVKFWTLGQRWFARIRVASPGYVHSPEGARPNQPESLLPVEPTAD